MYATTNHDQKKGRKERGGCLKAASSALSFRFQLPATETENICPELTPNNDE